MRNVRRITHFIDFSGMHVPATAENYAHDAARYLGAINFSIQRSCEAATAHDAHAYSRSAYQFARTAGHCALRALELTKGA